MLKVLDFENQLLQFENQNVEFKKNENLDFEKRNLF